MVTSPVLSVHDLRGAAVEYQRDRQHKSKWALGETYGPGQQMDTGKTKPRPFRVSQGSATADRKHMAKEVHKVQALRKLIPFADDPSISDSSTDDEVADDLGDASTTPEPDADITYSYDVPHGPVHDSQILSFAVAQAVERFENRATDRLVQEEYEVLDHDGESVVAGPSKPRDQGTKFEDDYELV